MAKKEAKTDFWVYGLLQEAGLKLEPQGSSIVEINNALKTASKAGSGKVGFPEFVGTVKDFLIIIENKPDTSYHQKISEDGVISTLPKDVMSFAVNGALFYAKHLSGKTSYKKIISFGISGDEKKHKITPMFINELGHYSILDDVESFILFNESNIDEYYIREILKENTNEEKDLVEILKDASELHEDLRNYGSLGDIEKPLIVSGILLALREEEHGGFSVDNLTGDTIETDGEKIYYAIERNLKRSKVSPEVKRDKVLSQFSIIKDNQTLNQINNNLNKTPLKHYSEFLREKIYHNIRYSKSSEDYLGRFYGEFMSYSGGDGQTLGIVLTPKHITDLFCELLDISCDDVILDPCAGTAGFLISAMHHMLQKTENENVKKNIKKKQLHGFEIQSYMFTIATTNMILRGDGKSNLINQNFLSESPKKIQLDTEATVGMMNPPYSQGSKKNPNLYEISFTEHLLDSLVEGGRAIVIIPQPSVAGKTKEEQTTKENILKKHTLEGVISLNKNTFYGVGTTPCIAIFTAGEKHPVDKECKFIDFSDDGFKLSPHIGLVETEQAKDKKQHLLDVWFDKLDFESKFCVKTTIEPKDEWLHAFYYFNDEIPKKEDFEKTISDFLSFRFSMVMQGRSNLFDKETDIKIKKIEDLQDKEWKEFFIKKIFNKTMRGKRLTKSNQIKGNIPYVSSTALNNGVDNFIGNTEDVRMYSNCLTVANSGSVGSTFFHPYEFIASDHVTHLKNEDFSYLSYLFIATLIGKISGKYNFNREINDTRISREKIILPINESGEPDYDYMEKFMGNLELEKREEYKKMTLI